MTILPEYFMEDLESYHEFSKPFREQYFKENGKYAREKEVMAAWKKTENQRLKERIRKLTEKLNETK